MDYLLHADEANPEQTDPNKFFIYGGVFFPVQHISAIHDAVEELRDEFDLGPADQLKFHTRSRPETINGEQHTEMKTRVFQIAADHDIVFCGYAILHAIARNQDHNGLVSFGANILLAKFNQFLGENDGRGWAQFDRMNTPDPFGYLQEKFQNRTHIEDQGVRLENIIGYSFTCDSASHLASVSDIIIGGFRYIINEPDREIAGRSILRSIVPLMWYRLGPTGRRELGNRGLVLRPRNIASPAYHAEYEEVRSRLREWSRPIS